MSALLVLLLMTGLGVIGFLDDFIKISKQRSLGLRSKQKLAGQIAIGVVFAVLALNFRNDQFRTPASPFISFVRDTHTSTWPSPARSQGSCCSSSGRTS